MPVIGETKQRFSRSYVWLNPTVGSSSFTAGTWRLTGDDEAGGEDPDISSLIESGIIAPGVTIDPSQLIYINDSGLLDLAKADSVTTGRVAGICPNWRKSRRYYSIHKKPIRADSEP